MFMKKKCVIYNYLCYIQQVNSATASPDTILVSMTISNPGSVTANNVTVTFDLTGGLRLDISSIVKNTSTDITHTQSNVKFQWYSSSIAGESL